MCKEIACYIRWDHKCVFWFPTHKVEIRGVTVILDKVTRDFFTHFFALHAAPLEEGHCDVIELNFECRESECTLAISPKVTCVIFWHPAQRGWWRITVTPWTSTLGALKTSHVVESTAPSSWRTGTGRILINIYSCMIIYIYIHIYMLDIVRCGKYGSFLMEDWDR